ncbi:hypothetical protein [uncultured Cohaesibacter sp.]|uniref:hypothetical protein n=1 Tax=uncultured Cohaesibacter sp. TaxID=1002546 RepID=UPI0029C833ED|nr:hypothetical protein [uncultured Cohaesibacter sp.]
MADYYVILKRAVSVLPEGTREQRQAIYDKARKALLAQLQNMDPPLAPAEITKQRMALEEAVRSVERDLTQEQDKPQAEESDAAPAVNVGERGDKAPASSAAPAAPEVSIGDDEREKQSEPADKSDHSPSRPANDRGERQEEIEPLSPSDKVIRRAGQDVLKNAVRDANAIGAATNAAVKSARDAADAVSEPREPRQETARQQERVEPSLGDSYGAGSKKSRPSSDPAPVAKDGPIRGLEDEDDEPKSRFGLFVGAVLLLGLIGGSGYLIYDNRDAFLAMIDGSGSDEGEVVVGSDDADPAVTEGGETIPSKTVRTVTVTPPDEGAPAADTTTAEAATPDTPGDAVEATEGTDETGSGDEASAGLTVAERSILYEEEGPNGEPGTANAGEVIWNLEGEGDDAVVVIAATIPDQNVSFDIRISKNSDAELPASHLIEISVIWDDDTESKAIASIPGLILKPTEQTRGEGLIGAAIPISSDLHWIALTAGEREINYNLELLMLRSWIDIPIQYASKRRAILTLEKGNSGDAVISDAIKAWSGQ